MVTMTTAMELARKLAEAREESYRLRKELKAAEAALDNALDNLDAERRKQEAEIEASHG